MPWNDTARVEHRRNCARYPSDLTDREWRLIEPLLPQAKPGGRRRTTDLRAVYDAIHYIAASGCQWRMLPSDFPNWSTVYGIFWKWRRDGTWQRIHDALREKVRKATGKKSRFWFLSMRRTAPVCPAISMPINFGRLSSGSSASAVRKKANAWWQCGQV